jgi:hypothetical protein
MRTKTMILSATCGLLGALAAQADSVYSVNVVGYVNKSFKAANNVLIANPLNSTNTLASLFPGFTDADGGSEIYAWNTTTLKYDYYTYVAGFGWMNGDTGDDASAASLPPGKGFWFSSENDITNTFVGEVPQGNLSFSVVAGWSQIAAQVPQAGSLVTQGLTGNPGDNIFKRGNGVWINWTYIDGTGWMNADTGDFEDPTADIGEAFWYQANAAFTWTRTFNVN